MFYVANVQDPACIAYQVVAAALYRRKKQESSIRYLKKWAVSNKSSYPATNFASLIDGAGLLLFSTATD